MADDDKKDDGKLEALMARLEAAEAKAEAAEGKANGILADKKKAQQRADELQAKLEEIEGKDLGEVEKLQRELERKDSRIDELTKKATEIEQNWQTDKRNGALSDLGSKFKWLDSVPEKTRKLIIENEFSDVDDLGNEVLVNDRLKAVSESYAGLLASDAPSGAGSKAGQPTNPNAVSMDAVLNPNLADVANDPLAYVMQAAKAAEAAE